MAVMIKGDPALVSNKMRDLIALFEHNGFDSAILDVKRKQFEVEIDDSVYYRYYVTSDRWVRYNELTNSRITGKYVSVFPAMSIDLDNLETQEQFLFSDDEEQETTKPSIIGKLKNKLGL